MLISFFLLFINEFWILLKEMSLWVLIGCLLSGILKIFISKEIFSSYLGKSNIYSVIKSSLLGIPLPLCSCGVIPVAQSLSKSGVSKGAIASFLISTPQTGIDSIMATYGFLGLGFTLLRSCTALLSGIFGGIMINFFMKPSKVNSKLDLHNKCIKTFEKKHRIYLMFYYGFIEMIKDLGKWIILGLLIASLFSVFFSQDGIEKILNNSWKEFLLIGLISIPLYICATGSIPIALVFISKGISPGAILIFLLLGPATNITTIIILIKNFGKKFTCIYLISLVVSSIFFAILVNKYFNNIILINKTRYINSIHNLNLLKIISAVILLLLLFNIFIFNVFFNNKKLKNIDQ